MNNLLSEVKENFGAIAIAATAINAIFAIFLFAIAFGGFWGIIIMLVIASMIASYFVVKVVSSYHTMLAIVNVLYADYASRVEVSLQPLHHDENGEPFDISQSAQ